jgi:DNA-directed RNA polymerase subunit RPC12/RpoP
MGRIPSPIRERRYPVTDTASFKCPNCGASLDILPNQASAKCPYCGNTVLVPQPAHVDDFRIVPPIALDSTIQTVLDLETTQAVAASSIFKSTMPWVFGGTIALPLVITALTFVLIICIFGVILLSFGSFFTMFR